MSSSPDKSLPTGTVTFLFTDIEGSTRLLSAVGRRYDDLLERHSAILRRAISGDGGVEVSTDGDAFFAVFASAVGAVRAVTHAQRDLEDEPWPDSSRLRVRMGLHSGEGRLGGDNYIGLDVHRAARIAAAGHGGQVLLSEATRALVAHDLPVGTAVRDLAEHRLKDLPAPERIWQLEIEGLPSDFPTIRSLDARPNNLPLPATSLIGRERELDDVSELVHRHRLVTLVGPGGTGKTRLALAVAHRLLAGNADGTFFVRLEDARDRTTVAATVAAALQVREKVDRELEAAVREYIATRELVLVLDNFEQAVQAAPLVADLLAASPKLRIIVTSRSPLHLSGEQEYAVPPLGLPDTDHLPPLSELSQYEAVALFIERATAVRSDFAVTNVNAPAVAQICSRLDGLPLAIELAAARVRLLSPEAILKRLVQRLPVLAGGPIDLPRRQRTLRSTMDWSYELLGDAERRLFERVAVFAGGWTIALCEQVCNPSAELGIDTIDLLTSLSDKSLIQPLAAERTEPRFGLLQVVREFALDRLEAVEDADEIRARHARAILGLAEQAEPELIRTDLPHWQQRIRREEDNIRTALRWAVATDEAATGLRIAAAVWRFWHYWAEFREGRGWLESLLALPSAASASEERAKGVSALASILYWQGEAAQASELYDEALAFYREHGDDRQIGEALYNAAWAAVGRHDVRAAVELSEQARVHYTRANDRAGAARVTAFLATGSFLMGGGGSKEDAVAAAREAVEMSREQGRLYDVADWLGSVSFVHFRAGELEPSLAAFRDTLRAWREMGNLGMLPFLKMGAALELRLGRPERAALLGAVAARAVDSMGGELPAAMVGDINPLDEARALLSDVEFASAIERGTAMTFDEVVAFALEEPAPREVARV